MISASLHSLRRQQLGARSMWAARSFATPHGDGISDPKNPRVFFSVAKNDVVIGDIQFEVSDSPS